MKKKNMSSLLILLTFLSGNFTLYRLGIDSNLSIKYILLIMFFFSLLIPVQNTEIEKKLYLNRKDIIFLMSIILYLVINLLSITYSPIQTLAIEKYWDLLFLFCLICGHYYTVLKFNLESFFKYISVFFIFVGIIYALPVLISAVTTGGRGRFSLGGPNVVTRILFFALISSLFTFSLKKENKYIILIILFFSSIILVGSRGGIVSALLSFLVLFLINKRQKKWILKRNFSIKLKYIGYLIVGMIAFSAIYENVIDIFLNRFLKLTFGGNEIYTAGRDNLYITASNMIRSRPITGHGLNSFDAYTGLDYPHNLILEMMTDVGIFGLIFFIIMLLLSIRMIYQYKYSKVYLFSILPLYMLIVQMFSGDIYDLRYWFFWIIPLIIFETGLNTSNNKKYYKSKISKKMTK